jgi:hypothetical protein
MPWLVRPREFVDQPGRCFVGTRQTTRRQFDKSLSDGDWAIPSAYQAFDDAIRRSTCGRRRRKTFDCRSEF